MTTMECGIPYGEVDTEAIRKGLRLAFPGRKTHERTQPVEAPIDWKDLLMWDEYRNW